MIKPAHFPTGQPWLQGYNYAISNPPLSERVLNAPIVITTFGTNVKDLTLKNLTAQRHSHIEIIWITEGSGHLMIDTEIYEICENLIYRINPGNVHYVKETSNVKGYIISIHKEFLFSAGEIFSEKHFNHGPVILHNHDTIAQKERNIKIEMIQILTSMQNELRNICWLQTDVLNSFLKIFLIYLARHRQVSSTPETLAFHSGLTKKFFDILEDSFTKYHRVSYYADTLSVTAGYLNERIKQDSGFSASFNIQQRIVLEAKRLAISSNLNLKQIAYYLGFDDAAHFSKFFKNVCGMNFTEFKQTMRLKYIL